jgi:hypothetical protein
MRYLQERRSARTIPSLFSGLECRPHVQFAPKLRIILYEIGSCRKFLAPAFPFLSLHEKAADAYPLGNMPFRWGRLSSQSKITAVQDIPKISSLTRKMPDFAGGFYCFENEAPYSAYFRRRRDFSNRSQRR